jgi:hypothetical protein
VRATIQHHHHPRIVPTILEQRRPKRLWNLRNKSIHDCA